MAVLQHCFATNIYINTHKGLLGNGQPFFYELSDTVT